MNTLLALVAPNNRTRGEYAKAGQDLPPSFHQLRGNHKNIKTLMAIDKATRVIYLQGMDK